MLKKILFDSLHCPFDIGRWNDFIDGKTQFKYQVGN